tara:strand:+ start:2305 stop:2916 length:612 start_codon:yes stop_codon:yes gene_type:complete
MNLDKLETGDIILFNNTSDDGYFKYFSDLLRFGTHSNYTHIGMVLKDPTFFNKNLTGLYFWESSWENIPDAQDNEIKLGVQIVPLKDVIEKNKDIMIARKVNCDNNLFNDKVLKSINDVVHNKPYDIIPKDWLYAFLKRDNNPQKIDRFWCSALVGYIYTKVGILHESTDWSILRPCDFALNSENLSFNKDCSLSNDEFLINK